MFPHTGETALHYAASQGHIEIAEKLLSTEGVHVNEADFSGNTALLKAATAGHVTIVEFLLVKGARQLQNKDGVTPLLIAAGQDSMEMVQLLLKAGGDAHLKVEGSSENNYIKLTPLLFAAGLGHEDVVIHILNEHK